MLEQPQFILILLVVAVVGVHALFSGRKKKSVLGATPVPHLITERPVEDSASNEPTSIFERDRSHDLSKPLFQPLGGSLFEDDKADDLTRPFGYEYKKGTETDLFELDKKDDLTRR